MCDPGPHLPAAPPLPPLHSLWVFVVLWCLCLVFESACFLRILRLGVISVPSPIIDPLCPAFLQTRCCRNQARRVAGRSYERLARMKPALPHATRPCLPSPVLLSLPGPTPTTLPPSLPLLPPLLLPLPELLLRLLRVHATKVRIGLGPGRNAPVVTLIFRVLA